MNRRKIDVTFSTFLILVSLIILFNDNLVEGGVETELGSMFLPRLVAVCIMIFSATIGIQSIVKLHRGTKLESEEKIDTTGFLGIALYLTIFVLYWLAVPYVGFLAATPFAMLGIAFLLGCQSWVTMVVISVITPLVVNYGCSNYLRVFLPNGSLF